MSGGNGVDTLDRLSGYAFLPSNVTQSIGQGLFRSAQSVSDTSLVAEQIVVLTSVLISQRASTKVSGGFCGARAAGVRDSSWDPDMFRIHTWRLQLVILSKRSFDLDGAVGCSCISVF